MRQVSLLFSILFSLVIFSSAYATTTIDAQVIRNQVGSGATLISSGFPLPPGLVAESIVAQRKIKVLVGGIEKAANISALRGRHRDGTVRSVLIQFTVDSMAQGDMLAAQVIVDGGVRVNTDPAYIRPVWSMVTNNNVVLPTSSDYLASTQITFQGLLPAGQGSVAEEKQYTELAGLKFDELVAAPNEGGAVYENVRAMLTLWARTGNKKYFNHAINYTQEFIKYTTADDPAYDCTNIPYINPDGRSDGTNDEFCGGPAEHMAPRSLSYAALYLLTGYRDFWGYVAYRVQSNQSSITDQETANQYIMLDSRWSLPRFLYSVQYEALLAAYYIDATIPALVPWRESRVLDFPDQFKWTLNAIKTYEWNFKWLQFTGGAGAVPAKGATVSQGGVSAKLMGVFPLQRFGPQRAPGEAMPSSGYLMVQDVTGGSFSAAALTGIGATATGTEESDYRQGLTGMRADSALSPNLAELTGSVSGTTLTVTALTPVTVPIVVGTNIEGGSIPEKTYIVSQASGTPGGIGTYTISASASTESIQIRHSTVIPSFQLVFVTNFLIDYYLNVYADPRIPAMVKKNLDVLLMQMRPLVSGDPLYGFGDAYWGYVAYGKSYTLENPVSAAIGDVYPHENPEYPRFIAFVLKTLGSDTVNGATYETWYSRLVDAANTSPYSGLIWQWKLFGQFYGFGADTPWIMAQSSLPGSPGFRTPTNYVAMPGDAPDVGGNISRRLSLAGHGLIKLAEPGP